MLYVEMTKKALLQVAAEHEIVGRHGMTKEALLACLLEETGEIGDDGEEALEPDVEIAPPTTIKQIKRRLPSMARRDDHNKVIRRGSNLSGNAPFQPKLYALDVALENPLTWTAEYKASFDAAPAQACLIIRYMSENGVVGDEGLRGCEIVEQAISKGYLKTKIEPAALYAFYARLLQALGVVHLEDMEG